MQKTALLSLGGAAPPREPLPPSAPSTAPSHHAALAQFSANPMVYCRLPLSGIRTPWPPRLWNQPKLEISLMGVRTAQEVISPNHSPSATGGANSPQPSVATSSLTPPCTSSLDLGPIPVGFRMARGCCEKPVPRPSCNVLPFTNFRHCIPENLPTPPTTGSL